MTIEACFEWDEATASMPSSHPVSRRSCIEGICATASGGSDHDSGLPAAAGVDGRATIVADRL
jgi:hypothetical protein